MNTREQFLAVIRDDRDNALLLKMFADFCEETGDIQTAKAIRNGTWIYQATKEGSEVVTVGRDGSRTASRGQYMWLLFCTKVYRAVRRKKDGVLTWRVFSRFNDSTAGSDITGRMIDRAKAAGERTGRPYLPGVVQNQKCP